MAELNDESTTSLSLFDGLNINFDSDSDDSQSEDKLKLTEEQEKAKRVAFLELCKKFKPQGGRKAWFNVPENEDIIDRLRNHKSAPTELKFSMEYFYMKRDFRKVCDIGHIFLDNKYLHGMHNNKEILEIIILSHLRLDEFKEAKLLTNSWKLTDGPRQIFLKAQVSSLSGDLEGTLALFKHYLRAQLIDYQSWKEMGLAIERYLNSELRFWSPIKIEDLSTKDIGANLATKCYELSHKIMLKQQWNVGGSNSSKHWFDKQVSLIKYLIERSKRISHFELNIDSSLHEWLLNSISALEEMCTSDKLGVEDASSFQNDQEEKSVLEL